MSTVSVEQSTVAGRQPSTNLVTLDSLLKYLAGFSLLLYCCGYFVVSVSSLGWGFSEAAPFRPKIASAGAWFILFLVVPLAAIIFQQKKELDNRTSAAESYQVYAMWGIGLGFGAASLFESTIQLAARVMLSPLLLVAGYIIIRAISGKGKVASTIRWAVSIASVLFVAGSGFYDLLMHHLVTVSAVFLWYLVVGFVSNFTFKMFRGRDTLANLATVAPYLVSNLLLAISTFGSVYYPHIKASWGGGTPVPVTIMFAKESPILPGQYLCTQLLDESEAGLYIAGKGENRASFIPEMRSPQLRIQTRHQANSNPSQNDRCARSGAKSLTRQVRLGEAFVLVGPSIVIRSRRSAQKRGTTPRPAHSIF